MSNVTQESGLFFFLKEVYLKKNNLVYFFHLWLAALIFITAKNIFNNKLPRGE